MTDTTKNLFARDLAEQTEQDDPVMVIMRADDARAVLALLGEASTPRGYLRDNDFAGKRYCTYCGAERSKYTSTPLLHTPDCLITRIKRVLAAHEPREKVMDNG